MNDKSIYAESKNHVFIIGAKSIGQYGGYETFVYRLICEHENQNIIQYHIACKANGDGYMDESKLNDVTVLKRNRQNEVVEFEYKNAHVFKIVCPNIGPGVAILYDWEAVKYSINFCKLHNIKNPVFYILTCRIGIFIHGLVRNIKSVDGRYYLNPDGHEWKRAKWSKFIRRYWKWSEKRMVELADLVICDSVNIEKYINNEYGQLNTKYIAYGADVSDSLIMPHDDLQLQGWLDGNNLKINEYYLIVGRFVPENNYATMIREFMRSHSKRDLVIITNLNEKYKCSLENTFHYSSDPRIKFVGTVYDSKLLKMIRECAYGYIHGHEVGGTNPSLLEALGSTRLNLLLDVGFNREVGQDGALYWNKEEGSLSRLIDDVDIMDDDTRMEYGIKAKQRIKGAYSWEFIGDEYLQCFVDEQLFLRN